MVVVINRFVFSVSFLRVFLYSLVRTNSFVFYSFLSLWFNVPSIYFKFLIFVNGEFGIVSNKAPNYYFLVYLPSTCIFSSIFSLPDFSKKQLLFGNHCFRVLGFDLFKLSFWSGKRFWWLGFRKYFTSFSVMLLLYLGYTTNFLVLFWFVF
jgi:hypothetical protein